MTVVTVLQLSPAQVERLAPELLDAVARARQLGPIGAVLEAHVDEIARLAVATARQRRRAADQAGYRPGGNPVAPAPEAAAESEVCSSSVLRHVELQPGSLSTGEVAVQLGLTDGRIRQIARTGVIGTRVGGVWRFTEDDLRRLEGIRDDRRQVAPSRAAG